MRDSKSSILLVGDGSNFCHNLAAELAANDRIVDVVEGIGDALGKLTQIDYGLVILRSISCEIILQEAASIRNIGSEEAVLAFCSSVDDALLARAQETGVLVVPVDNESVAELAAIVSETIQNVTEARVHRLRQSKQLFGKGKEVDVEIVDAKLRKAYRSQVIDRDESSISLSPIRNEQGERIELPTKSILRVSACSKDACYSFITQLKFASDDREALVIGKPGVIYRLQRRKFPRYAAEVPVSVAIFDEDIESNFQVAHGYTQDISRGGLRMHLDTPLEPGEAVRVELSPPGAATAVTGTAYVIRAKDSTDPEHAGCVVACNFTRVDDEIADILPAESDSGL